MSLTSATGERKAASVASGNATAAALPSFDEPDIAAQLISMSDAGLDALPFGVIEMDHDYKVLRVNATQSRHTNLARDRVIGRHYFREITPSANNREVAKRYQVDALDETFPYSLNLQMKSVTVTLRLLKPAYNQRMYLLVNWP
jgi:photoactive yellow protein